jgi:hypothetical protein
MQSRTNPIWPDATNLTRRKRQTLSADAVANDGINRIGHPRKQKPHGALLAVAPEAKDGKVDGKAEFLVTMTWPDPHPDDFDMFVQDPLGNMVWYRRREASAYYCVAFSHVEGLPGWSATAPLPPQFQILWARVVEPNPLDRDPGAVHIWVEDLDAANLPSGQPRAYRLPYSAALAAKVEAARDEIIKGHPQGGRAADFGAGNGQPAPEGPSDVSTFRHSAAPGGDPTGGGPLDLSFLTGESGNIEFAPLPVPILPAKDTP